MVEVIKITKNEITPFIKNFEKYAPKVIGNGLFKITQYGQTQLRRSISYGGVKREKPLRWTGNLWNRTRARKLSKNRSVIFVPSYGVALDSMTPHFVSLKRGRNITRWAMQAPNSPWKGSKPRHLPRAIFVRARPWIDRPLQLTDKNSIKIMNKELNKVMK